MDEKNICTISLSDNEEDKFVILAENIHLWDKSKADH